jgi:hypothetical protein
MSCFNLLALIAKNVIKYPRNIQLFFEPPNAVAIHLIVLGVFSLFVLGQLNLVTVMVFCGLT